MWLCRILYQAVINLDALVSGIALCAKGPYYVRPFKPEWRNWYTHQTQNLASFTAHVGSSPTSGTKPQLNTSITWRSFALKVANRLVGSAMRPA